MKIGTLKSARTINGTGNMSHIGRVTFIDHHEEILKQINANASAALQALGIKAVGLINKQMQDGYGRPIWKTGDLQRDVNFAVEQSGEKTVDVGNSLEYAPFVHEGTCKMEGRPYIQDALANGKDELQEVLKEYLKQGFDG